MHENLGSKFFKITTGIQSQPDAFDKLMFNMTLLTILGVTEILSSLKLVLEKFFRNNFVLQDAEDNTSGPLNRGGITELCREHY